MKKEQRESERGKEEEKLWLIDQIGEKERSVKVMVIGWAI